MGGTAKGARVWHSELAFQEADTEEDTGAGEEESR